MCEHNWLLLSKLHIPVIKLLHTNNLSLDRPLNAIFFKLDVVTNKFSAYSSYTYHVLCKYFLDPSGVHINVILQNLKLKEHLSHVPNETIRRTINELEDNSDVYETSSNSFRIVN